MALVALWGRNPTMAGCVESATYSIAEKQKKGKESWGSFVTLKDIPMT